MLTGDERLFLRDMLEAAFEGGLLGRFQTVREAEEAFEREVLESGGTAEEAVESFTRNLMELGDAAPAEGDEAGSATAPSSEEDEPLPFPGPLDTGSEEGIP